MTPSWLVRIIAYVMVFLAALPPILIFGPAIEARLFPVIDLRAANVSRQNNLLTFDIVGEKFRGCQMNRMTFAWRFDGLRTFATIYDGAEVFEPRPVISAGETFRFGPLTAMIPNAAGTYKNAALTAIVYYRCHPLYELEGSFAIQIGDHNG